MTRCTGACCQAPIVLNHSRKSLRQKVDIDRDPESAKIWTLLRPLYPSDPYCTDHACQALTAAGCALDRADRPQMCLSFPYDFTRPCGDCGAASDAEARGVALMAIGGRA